MKMLIFFSIVLLFVFVMSGSTTSKKQNGKKSYNFIIVGAGSAGSIVAAELAEHFPEKDVLLIEEGYYSKINPAVEDMALVNVLQADPTTQRNYKTIPQENAFNREYNLDRGKITGLPGGSNSWNGQVYIWCHEKDFERWGNIDGWTLDDLLPLWEELEGKTFHGFESSLGDRWMERVVNASGVLGYEFNEKWFDLSNGKSAEGVCFLPKQSEVINSSYVARRSSWTDYIEPILDYDNLDIIVLKRVNKLVLNEGMNKKVIGVEIQDIGTSKTQIINVKDEVILSASVYDSPKILQLSGIGDCDDLDRLGISCEVNLTSVGKSLQNHVIFIITSPPIIDTEEVVSQLPEYFDASGGLIGAGLVTENGDYHYIIFFNTMIDENSGLTRYRLNLAVIGNRMLSQGTVSLFDNNPNSLPIIDHNFFDNSNDMQVLIGALRKGREFLYDTSVFDGIFEDKENEISPGYNIQTDDEINEWIKTEGMRFFGVHPTGGCPMADDSSGVVNKRLQVNGVKHLRVCDSSIMPKTVSANTNQMSMLIGLKCAKMIIQDHA